VQRSGVGLVERELDLRLEPVELGVLLDILEHWQSVLFRAGRCDVDVVREVAVVQRCMPVHEALATQSDVDRIGRLRAEAVIADLETTDGEVRAIGIEFGGLRMAL